MKTILLQLHPSSNEFVFSFFVKLENEDHDIPIYVLMCGSSTICLTHLIHTKSLHVALIVLSIDSLD